MRIKIFFTLTLLFSVSAFGNFEQYASKMNNKLLKVEKLDENLKKTGIFFYSQFNLNPKTSFFYPINLGGNLDRSFAGACINFAEKKCSTNKNLNDLYREYTRRSSGYSILPDDFRGFPESNYKTVSTIQIKEDTLILSAVVSSVLIDERTKIEHKNIEKVEHFKIYFDGPFSGVDTNFAKNFNDTVDRKDIQEVEPELKDLAQSVFYLSTNSEPIESELGGTVQMGYMGSGFFISNKGYFLTNHHVILNESKCLEKLECSLKLSITKGKDDIETSTVNVEVHAYSEKYDFALLKIKSPNKVSFSHLEIEHNKFGPELFTLGYPGDKAIIKDEFDANGNFVGEKTTPQLIYSFGNLTGLNYRTFSTSIYTSGGASGSAILNEQSKVIGYLSNGSGTLYPEKEVTPTIVRPIHIIDDIYNINDYVSGEKQQRMSSLLSQLQDSQGSESKEIIEAIKNENSYYKFKELKTLMITHRDKKTRDLILKLLETISIVK
jgi:S1-C subfamily serine protease